MVLVMGYLWILVAISLVELCGAKQHATQIGWTMMELHQYIL
jgi:hypothetical protein